MKARRIGLLGLLGVVLSVGGCGGDSDNGREDGSESGPALEEVPALLAEALCGVLDQCFDDVLTDLFLGGADCVEENTRTFEDGTFSLTEQAVADGRVEYHPSEVESCLEGIRDLGCDVFTGWYLDECEAALSGTVAEGGDCTIDTECQGDLICRVEASCPGTCGPRGAAGDDCEDNDDCGDGLVCNEAQGLCASPVQEGQPCNDTTAPCAFGLDCRADGDSGDEVCLALTSIMSEPAGEPCNLANDDEEIVLCEPSLVCALAVEAGTLTQTCGEPSATSGGVCQLAYPDECPTGEFCDVDTSSDSLEGVCRPLPIDGQACAGLHEGDDAAEGECAADHVCIEDEVGGPTCRELQRVGGECVDDAQCYSENCESGACAVLDPCE